ncbi:acyl--CoA ligase [candidate division KSB1 bacterium]|nr:acyl--CoA ligase [candidate division KSB1 bacterium]
MAAANQTVEELARALSARFPVRGSRIGLWGRNSADYALAIRAILRAGQTAVPLSTRWDSTALAAALARTELSGIIDFDERCPIADTTACLSHGELAQDVRTPAVIPGHPAANEIAALVFTSGSSGELKVVAHTYGSLLAHARSVCAHLKLTASDCWLACLPLYHIGGLAIPLRCAEVGAGCCYCDSSDLDGIERRLDSGEISIVSLVPTQLQRVLDRRAERPFHRRLRAIIVGGGTVSPALLERCSIAYPTYGLTESGSMLTCARPGADARERNSAGAALPGVELRIVNAHGGVLPHGERGEITARGPGLARGYWKDPNATALAFREGWLWTGDLGQLDESGYLHLHGRADLQMKSGGEKIHPAELERALEQIAGVRQAVVLPVADAEWGQRPVAFVALRPGATRTGEELRTELSRLLPAWKLPLRIELVAALPLLDNGKVDLSALRNLLRM